MTWKLGSIGILVVALGNVAPHQIDTVEATKISADLPGRLTREPVPAAAQAKKPQRCPFPPPGRAKRESYFGTVVAIDKESVTVAGTDGRQRIFLANDDVLGVAPKPPPVMLGPRTYTLADVEIGDRIGVEYVSLDGVGTCYDICIRRRPGGRIPPQPGNFAMPSANVHHGRMQAYQDWEERGIFPPEKYAKDMRNAPAWVLSRPYPPIAPPPRELVGRIHSSQRDDYPPDAEALARTRTLATASTVQLVNDNAPGVVTAAGKGWIMIRVDGARFARVFYTTATLPKVRIGDRVQVWYDRFDDANVCREVEITKRAKPDTVPPATIPPAKD